MRRFLSLVPASFPLILLVLAGPVRADIWAMTRVEHHGRQGELLGEPSFWGGVQTGQWSDLYRYRTDNVYIGSSLRASPWKQIVPVLKVLNDIRGLAMSDGWLAALSSGQSLISDMIEMVESWDDDQTMAGQNQLSLVVPHQHVHEIHVLFDIFSEDDPLLAPTSHPYVSPHAVNPAVSRYVLRMNPRTPTGWDRSPMGWNYKYRYQVKYVIDLAALRRTVGDRTFYSSEGFLLAFAGQEDPAHSVTTNLKIVHSLRLFFRRNYESPEARTTVSLQSRSTGDVPIEVARWSPTYWRPFAARTTGIHDPMQSGRIDLYPGVDGVFRHGGRAYDRVALTFEATSSLPLERGGPWLAVQYNGSIPRWLPAALGRPEIDSRSNRRLTDRRGRPYDTEGSGSVRFVFDPGAVPPGEYVLVFRVDKAGRWWSQQQVRLVIHPRRPKASSPPVFGRW